MTPAAADISMAARAFYYAVAALLSLGGAALACETLAGRAAGVGAVLDGQTLRLDDGGEVRLSGALAPQTPPWWKEDIAWPPATAARQELERLIGANSVELRFAPGEARRDRHGRHLAQVYVLRGEERIWAQAHLIGKGVAQAYSFAGHRACARALQVREAAARDSRAGLWRAGRFSVLPAVSVADVAKRRGRFLVVKGTVRAVGRTSRWTFLNFGENWREDFTVAIRAGDARGFAGSDVDLERIEGMTVRVRGWVESWNGPVIKATHPEQIEVLGVAAGVAPGGAAPGRRGP